MKRDEADLDRLHRESAAAKHFDQMVADWMRGNEDVVGSIDTSYGISSTEEEIRRLLLATRPGA